MVVVQGPTERATYREQGRHALTQRLRQTDTELHTALLVITQNLTTLIPGTKRLALLRWPLHRALLFYSQGAVGLSHADHYPRESPLGTD